MNIVSRFLWRMWVLAVERANDAVDRIESLSREDPAETRADIDRVYSTMTQVLVDNPSTDRARSREGNAAYFLRRLNLDPSKYTADELAFLDISPIGATYINPAMKLIPLVSIELQAYICCLYKDYTRVQSFFQNTRPEQIPLFTENRMTCFPVPRRQYDAPTGAFLVDYLVLERALSTLDDQLRYYEKVPSTTICYSYQTLTSRACLEHDPIHYVSRAKVTSVAELDRESATTLAFVCHTESPAFKRIVDLSSRHLGTSNASLIEDGSIVPLPNVLVTYLCGREKEFVEFQKTLGRAAVNAPETATATTTTTTAVDVDMSNVLAQSIPFGLSPNAIPRNRRKGNGDGVHVNGGPTHFESGILEKELKEEDLQSGVINTILSGPDGDQVWVLLKKIAPYLLWMESVDNKARI